MRYRIFAIDQKNNFILRAITDHKMTNNPAFISQPYVEIKVQSHEDDPIETANLLYKTSLSHHMFLAVPVL